ncbi:reverse transcriptase [Lasius niger]|uniref:Reverse transcriptase n=1 Tax=Lasius niger TaxID=67767 RepID=A0A0J7K366_LASNI|nr:reverse transcriptase [Lasius niger]
MIEAVLMADGGEAKGDLDEHRTWLLKTMEKACNAAMPKVKARSPRKAYWWSEEIAKLRRVSDHARRTVRRRKRKSKARAWKELLSSLDEDPWGRPYRMVLNKLRGGTAPITETLDPQLINRVIDTLFPHVEEKEDLIPVREWEWDGGIMGVTGGELRDAVRKIKNGKAPGPDGIYGKAWVLAHRGLAKPMRHLYTECFRMGIFSREWKEAHVVLLPKQGKPKDSPSAYRPICLLDEAGKILEKIIANRLVYHLSRDGPNLSEEQYGFRAGRSTIDAVLRVRSIAEAVTEGGGVLLAVSLDISNAFNTLPWHRVGEALRYHRVPPYLVAILRDYFRDRMLAYTDRDAEERRRRMSCGVPQGSVLGPLMWNLAYDVVLWTALPLGYHAICYADDTLVMAGGETWEEATARANLAMARVVRLIKQIGLKVAPQKTEAVFMHNGSQGMPPKAQITVENTPVEMETHMKYLGLHLDGKWSFGEHFLQISPRVERAAMALCRLLPNLGGPDESVRRLYAGTVHSMLMYGAPVWAEKLEATRKAKDAMHQLQKRVANRICRDYCTFS